MGNLNVQQLYYEFERDVYNLIRKELKKEDKEEIISNFRFDKGFEADFYLPQGCGNLGIPAKTMIEIKLQIVLDIVPRLRNVIDAINHNHKEEPFHLWLIVKDEDRLDPINNQDEEKTFRVMTWQQFSTSPESETDKKNHILTSDTFSEIKQQVPLPSPEEIILRAHDDAQTKNITLFLGAGVSMAAGLPSWECLLCKLRNSIGENPDIKVDASCLEKNENSSIILAKWYQLVCNSIDNNAQERKEDDTKEKTTDTGNRTFEKILHKCLYESIVTISAPLLTILTNILFCYKNRATVITYNYDDIVEQILQKNHIAYKQYFPSSYQEPGEVQEIPILHVHGIMPQDTSEIARAITLDEDAYHEQYNNPYHWSNIVQLNALNQSACYFIGLSMTDPNLRRILSIMKQRITDDPKNMRYYVFMAEPDNHGEKDIFAQDMRTFGIETIWYSPENKHAELRAKLSDVFNVPNLQEKTN